MRFFDSDCSCENLKKIIGAAGLKKVKPIFKEIGVEEKGPCVLAHH